MEQLKEFFEKIPNAKILDVGTGRGNFIALIDRLYKDYQEIIGIDIIDGFVKAASNAFKQNKKVKFEKRDILDTGYETESFDIVCLSNSLHHLADIKSMIEAMEKLVKPGGYLLFNEMMSDHLNNSQVSHKLIHHFSAKLDREIGLTHNETYRRQEIIDVVKENTTFAVVDTWNMKVPIEEISPEQLTSYIEMVDILVNRMPLDKQENHKEEAITIKKYIQDNGMQGCTQILIICQRKV